MCSKYQVMANSLEAFPVFISACLAGSSGIPVSKSSFSSPALISGSDSPADPPILFTFRENLQEALLRAHVEQRAKAPD